MSVLFLHRDELLAKVAAKAGERSGVRVTACPVEAFAGVEAGTRVVVVPWDDVATAAAAAVEAGARLVVYGRDAMRRAAELPERAVPLGCPFRAADLGALIGPAPGPACAPAPGTPPPAADPALAPRAPAVAATAPTPTAPEGEVAGEGRGYRILAVDDDAMIRRIYRRILGDAGYHVELADDGEDAWAKLPAFGPDLIVSDVEMPRLDGHALCKRVKEHPQWASVPFMICSSLAQGHDVVRGFECGTDDYLIKPIHEDELLARVRDLLASIEQAGRETILVVDDSRITRNLIRGGLAKQGFAVETAGDGNEALAKLREMPVPPSVILSDFEMPGMSGFELAMALRRDPASRGIPLIVMSARDDTRHRKLMRTAGAVGFIAKPFDPDKMAALVERVLAEQQLKEEKARIRELIADDAMAEIVREVRRGRRTVARVERMTILFSDLAGFTSMSARLPAQDVVDLLNGYFDAMVPAIRDAGGDVDKFIGDAIMARFRDPDDGMEREPGAVRAIRAALGMLRALAGYNETLPEGRRLHMRIGINTGEVVIGGIGASSRRDFTTIGDAVNRAQRHESQAKHDGVLISQDTYELVKHRVRVRRRPEKLALKGIAEPVDAYDVLGIKQQQEE